MSCETGSCKGMKAVVIERLRGERDKAQARVKILKALIEADPVDRERYETSVTYGIDQCNRADAAEKRVKKQAEEVERLKELAYMAHGRGLCGLRATAHPVLPGQAGLFGGVK